MLHWVLSTSSVAARTPDWGNVWRRERRPRRGAWRGARGVRTVSCLSQAAGRVMRARSAVIVRVIMTVRGGLARHCHTLLAQTNTRKLTVSAHHLPSQSGISELFSFD